jgi:hypothetical protein
MRGARRGVDSLGQLVSWSATQTGNGTYTGTITVHVTRSTRRAAAGKGTDVTYTLDATKVAFGQEANPPWPRTG